MNLDLIENNELSANANGGTEQMLRRLYSSLPRDLLERFQIIPSRVRELNPQKYRIYWCHDLPDDPEVINALGEGQWQRFHRIVCVSNWQAQRFIDAYGISWSRCVVLLNGIEPIQMDWNSRKYDGEIKFIYHTTPHRGLNILLPVFAKLAEKYQNIHLDVYSSYALYGWKDRDEQFNELFDFMKDNDFITDHGTVSNEEVREALKNSHIFAYPSLWPETSCLCLMEAMSAGLNCVHPNYGALYETAANWTSMYHWHEDIQKHAELFFMMLDNVIQNIANENIHGRLQSQKVYADAFYNWNVRAKQWEALLQSVLNSGESLQLGPPEKVFEYSI